MRSSVSPASAATSHVNDVNFVRLPVPVPPALPRTFPVLLSARRISTSPEGALMAHYNALQPVRSMFLYTRKLRKSFASTYVSPSRLSVRNVTPL